VNKLRLKPLVDLMDPNHHQEEPVEEEAEE